MYLVSSFPIFEGWGVGLGMMHFYRVFPAVIFLLASMSSFCLADGWQPVIEPTELVPDYVIAVDKKAQRLHLLAHKSPLHAESTFTCATGQVSGDKTFEGDLKTPEGVYFTTGKRTGLKDFALYGTMAFPLDFPNPVDRIKGKTGYGIWIHGRGKKLVPMDTQGCVALVNEDIGVLDTRIAPGAPVVIGETMGWADSQGKQSGVSAELKKLVHKWAEDWENRSEGFFAAYAPDLFTKSERRSFEYFKKRKKRIFSSTDWIDVEIYNLRALPGPDYWVTWFDQYYRSGRLSSSTSKRLYWQNIDGEWKIVGREYGPSIRSLRKKYLDSKRESVKEFLDKWSSDWLAADLESYINNYTSSARQGRRRGSSAIREQKERIWEKRRPSVINIGKIRLREHPEGLEVVFRQDYSDISGYSDKGFKKLVIRPAGGSWLIVDEQWRKL